MATCNTSIESSRSRNWCFTLNNYTNVDIGDIQAIDCKYVFQEEMGESKTPHLQGVLMFKDAKSFSKIKKMIPRAHWEKCKSKIASIKYCSKEDSRNGEIYSNLENFAPLHKKKSVDFNESLNEYLCSDEWKIDSKIVNKIHTEYDFWLCEYGCLEFCNCKK